MVVSFISHASGRVKASSCGDLVSGLRSSHAFAKLAKPGEFVERTIDLFTSPGIVYLLHADSQQLEQDYQQIRAWERTEKLFVLGS